MSDVGFMMWILCDGCECVCVLFFFFLIFFFFQAEDGIRDIGVTGVQTCALPICIYPMYFLK